MSEWKPRGRDVVIGNIPWLARVTDKARAKADGTIGEYIYPCPVDRRFLEKAGLSADEFVQLAVEHQSDDDLVKAFNDRTGNQDWSNFQ